MALVDHRGRKYFAYRLQTLMCLETDVYMCLAAQSCLSLCDPMDYSPPEDRGQGFFRQEYWSGLPFPPPGDLPDPKMEPSELQADSLPLSLWGSLLNGY